MNIAILLILGLVIIVSLGFKRVIYLYFIRLFYGEFSRKFVNHFKSITHKKPHPYCFKDGFHYHILEISKAVNIEKQYICETPLVFAELDFDKNFKQILEERGRPDCYTISDDDEWDICVVGYKSRQYHSNEKTLLYHYNEKYFMGEYVFSDLSENTASLVVQTLREQMHPKVEYAKNFTIHDSHGNHVFFTDTGFFLSLKLFNTNHAVVKEILRITSDNINNNTAPLKGINDMDC
jgi:hypothetical protein